MNDVEKMILPIFRFLRAACLPRHTPKPYLIIFHVIFISR